MKANINIVRQGGLRICLCGTGDHGLSLEASMGNFIIGSENIAKNGNKINKINIEKDDVKVIEGYRKTEGESGYMGGRGREMKGKGWNK